VKLNETEDSSINIPDKKDQVEEGDKNLDVSLNFQENFSPNNKNMTESHNNSNLDDSIKNQIRLVSLNSIQVVTLRRPNSLQFSISEKGIRNEMLDEIQIYQWHY
jgi:hypothetical protein